MLKIFTRFFICRRITALALPFAVWLVVLLLVQQSAAQPALNVWRSSGPNADVTTVVVDPNNPNIIYAGSYGGVFKSVNNGASWLRVNLMGVRDLAVDPVNPNTIYAVNYYGAYKSTDGGVTWNGLNLSAQADKVEVAQSNPNIIYAGGYGGNAINVFVSTNGGTTWNIRPIPGSANFNVFLLEVNPQNPDIIYVWGQDFESPGCYKSINGGISWTEIFGSANMKIDQGNPNILYAGVGWDVYKSTDGGASWARRGRTDANIIALAIDPRSPGTLYAGTFSGVYKSTDDGVTWLLFNNGLNNNRVGDFAFDRSGRFLHAATLTGVFSVRVREDSNVNPNADFDGDGRSDISVFRQSDGAWYLNSSTQGFSATQFGLSTDKITPADYDGDGKTDIAVYREGTWYWLNSSNGGFNAIQFGLASDIPQPADFDGDGRAELAVYRGGNWYTLNLANNQFNAVQFGLSTDKPVVADYDGDGRADYAVY